ncbi:MAG: glycosyltransferase [Carbonactinosporaceae bacterium]
MPSRQRVRVTAVVVTHNRRELLAESLAAVRAQTRAPDAVIVVDNASGDGTADLVRDRFGWAELVSLPHNTGGAGGFAAGLTRALARHADLVWLMDDDTVPAPDALAALLEARDSWRAGEPPAVLASRVVWTDGRDHPMNTPRQRFRVSRAERAAATAAGCLAIRSASFVSLLVDADAVRREGLPVADYFLWNDDFEFTARLLRDRTGLLCPASVATHRTRAFGGSLTDPGDRFFYEVRNKVWVFARSRALAPGERPLYAALAVFRWARTLALSRDRVRLAGALRRGLIAGLRTRPRPTERVLPDLVQVAPDVPAAPAFVLRQPTEG